MDIAKKLELTKSIIDKRYSDEMNTLYTSGDYQVKPAFAEKWQQAFNLAMDTVNSSTADSIRFKVLVYSSGNLTNVSLTRSQFSTLFNVVMEKYTKIETKYQAYQVEFESSPTSSRLDEIIASGEFFETQE